MAFTWKLFHEALGCFPAAGPQTGQGFSTFFSTAARAAENGGKSASGLSHGPGMLVFELDFNGFGHLGAD